MSDNIPDDHQNHITPREKWPYFRIDGESETYNCVSSRCATENLRSCIQRGRACFDCSYYRCLHGVGRSRTYSGQHAKPPEQVPPRRVWKPGSGHFVHPAREAIIRTVSCTSNVHPIFSSPTRLWGRVLTSNELTNVDGTHSQLVVWSRLESGITRPSCCSQRSKRCPGTNREHCTLVHSLIGGGLWTERPRRTDYFPWTPLNSGKTGTGSEPKGTTEGEEKAYVVLVALRGLRLLLR